MKAHVLGTVAIDNGDALRASVICSACFVIRWRYESSSTTFRLSPDFQRKSDATRIRLGFSPVRPVDVGCRK